ncbi:MAG: AAA family ATPase [Bacteroidetes bacterium]|nr:AAA family ATPase [Bacteroidota bacterium]
MRYLSSEIDRLFAEENKMCLIAGPRQVGKTTLAKHWLEEPDRPQAYFNWDIDSDRRSIIKYPDDFWMRKNSSLQTPVKLALDEIHKFPRWKRFLKGLYDSHGDNLRIMVTGSGKLDVYQKGGDSLFGRYQLYHLHPFTLGECLSDGKPFHPSPKSLLEEILRHPPTKAADENLRRLEKFTGFPEPLFAGSESRLRRWSRSHEQLIIREELRDLTRIRELGLIETLVSLLPERTGSPLSINSLREDVGVRFETIQNWLGALSRLFYLFSIRPYAGKLVRTLRREEKFYLFDYSVIEDAGARFETMTALHLRKLCDYWTETGQGDFQLHYVRDRERRETDFLISQDRQPFALVEVKLKGSNIDPSLRYFSDRLKPKYSMQIVREGEGFREAFVSKGILLTTAAQALAVM